MKLTAIFMFILLSINSFAATQFDCVGTEPFWSLKTSEKNITLKDPIHLDGETLKIISRKAAAGTALDFATVIKSKYTSLSILRSDCNDGMSDEKYEFSVIVDKGDTVLTGCCHSTK